MDVVFYEKTGCVTNSKQKALLKAAGLNVTPRNILRQPWTPLQLRRFFDALPVKDWFNPQAPAIKSGEVKPDTLAKLEALELLSNNPLLIRRPLIETAHSRWAGFDAEVIRREFGIDVYTSAQTCGKERCNS